MKAKDVKYIVVHCSDTPNGRYHTAEDIHRWHTEAPRNWSGIGYHFVIRTDGVIDSGRPLYWQGAHVRGYNHESIGICLIGRDDFSKVQKRVLSTYLKILLKDFPNARVVGHSDLDAHKTCPNFDVKKFMESVEC